MRVSPPANLVRRSYSLLHSLRCPIAFRAAMLLFLLCACSVPNSRAQQLLPSRWDSVVREFAGKIVAAGTVRGEGSLEVQNLSSLDASTVADIENSLLAQLSSKGFRRIP